jgi:hypothetical protein
MKITSDLTNLTTTTAILILTVQMFIEWTLGTVGSTEFRTPICMSLKKTI